MTTAFEEDILAELRERDLEVETLRWQLRTRGHSVSPERVYESLAHLEANELVRVNATQRWATWEAA